jgi:hypothetical protein
LSAVAHQLIDEPLDPAEAEMSEAAFEVIQRAYAICGHPPARELPVEVGLDQRAEQALAEAQVILQEFVAESLTEAVTTVFPLENSEMSDEYDGSTFEAACRQADAKASSQPIPVEIQRARRLLEDRISLEGAYSQINSRKGRAANSTVDALVFSLRSGVKEIEDKDVRRRLSELSDQQLHEVGDLLQRLRSEIARAWSADEIEALMLLRETLR